MPRIIGAFVSSLAVLGFVSMAAAAPVATDIVAKVSSRDLVEKVDFKCRKVEGGKIVCGSTKGNKNKDRDDDDDDQKGKGEGKGKGKQEDSGLSECTIQTPNSGGGCKNGTWKCEKMKSGKKCCGCVPNKNAPTGGGGAQPTCESQCAAKCAPLIGAEDHGVCISECKFNKFVPACK